MSVPGPSGRARPARIGFVCFALALFIATHWPNFRIEHSPIPRPDLLLHAGAFGVWTALLIATRWTGIGTRAVLRGVAIALVYAALDEALQLIPALGRTAALDDYGADATGIVLAGLACLAVDRARNGATWASGSPGD